MQLLHLFRKLVSFPKEILLFCSAGERSLLPDKLETKYAALGGLVVATTTIAFCSGSYALTYVFGSQLLGWLGGTVWAWFVFFLDRALLSSPKQEKESFIEKIGKFTLRAVIGSFLGIIVALPMETLIFKDSAQLEQTKKIQEQINDLNTIINETHFKTVRANGTQNQDFVEEEAILKKERDKLYTRKKLIEKGSLNTPEMALSVQVHTIWTQALSNPVDGVLHIFIIIVFWGFEVAPIFIKTFVLKYDAYDHAFNIWEESRKQIDGVCIKNQEIQRQADWLEFIRIAAENTRGYKVEKAIQLEKEWFEEAMQKSKTYRYPQIVQYLQAVFGKPTSLLGKKFSNISSNGSNKRTKYSQKEEKIGNISFSLDEDNSLENAGNGKHSQMASPRIENNEMSDFDSQFVPLTSLDISSHSRTNRNDENKISDPKASISINSNEKQEAVETDLDDLSGEDLVELAWQKSNKFSS